jgi:hypothetical protein
MLKTTDQRCFFTHKNNYPQLVEFARSCDAEISIVKAQNVKILDLPELAKSICNHGQQAELPQYELVEVKVPTLPPLKNRSRSNLLMQANIVSSYVKKKLLNSKIVSLTDLENKFSDFGLSKSTLYNHLARVRNELKEEGYEVSKIKPGTYRMKG